MKRETSSSSATRIFIALASRRSIRLRLSPEICLYDTARAVVYSAPPRIGLGAVAGHRAESRHLGRPPGAGASNPRKRAAHRRILSAYTRRRAVPPAETFCAEPGRALDSGNRNQHGGLAVRPPDPAPRGDPMKTSLVRGLTLALTLTLAGVAGIAHAEWQDEFDKGKQALVDKDYRTAEEHLIAALGETKDGDEQNLRTLVLLAKTYTKMRQWAAAAPMYQQVLDGYKAAGTDKSPDAANTLMDLGIVYHHMKEYDKAEEAYQASLAIKRRRYRDNTASIAAVVTNLAELYRRQKNWEKAEELLQQAISDKEQELGPEHPSLVSSLTDLALVHLNRNQFDKARPLLERAMGIAKQQEGGKSDEMATVLHNMGMLCAGESKMDEAIAYYKQALAMREELLGPKHPMVATTLINLANAYTVTDKAADALPLYDRAVGIREMEFGKTSREVATALRSAVIAYDRLGKKDEAEKIRARLKEMGQ
ncbi:MAG: tetratricopeptide repeat protein [Deltaproteobacteria bacterium]|nr:MAG: tetratricopeptide repeat protein [Deltaproteobacteria bacterium]